MAAQAQQPAFSSAEAADTGLSPEQLQRRRMLAEAMLKEAGNYAPIQSWTQGLARVTDSVMGGLDERWANDKENYQRDVDNASLLGLPGPTGQAPPDSPFGYIGRSLGMGGGSKAQDQAMPPADVGTGPGPQATAGDPAPAAADHNGGPAAPVGKGSPARMAAMDQLVAAGYTPAAAAGLVGNWSRESGDFHPDIIKSEGGDLTKDAGYMGQWRGSRLLGARDYFKKNGGPSLQNNVGYALHELDTTENATKLALANAKTPQEAAAIAAGFERPRGYKRGGDPRQIDGWGDRAGAAQQAFAEWTARQAGGANVAAAAPPPGAPPQITPAAQAAVPGPVSPAVAAGPVSPQAAPGPVAGGPQAAPLAPEANVYNGPGAPTASAGMSDAPPQGLPQGTPMPGSPLAGGGAPAPQAPPPMPAAPGPGANLPPGAATVAAASAGAPPPPPPQMSPGAQQVAQAQVPELAPVPPMPDFNAPTPTPMDIMRKHPELRRLMPALTSRNPQTQRAALGQIDKYIQQQSPAGQMEIRQAVIAANKGLVDTQKTQEEIRAMPGQRALVDAQAQKALEDVKTEPLNRDKISAETDLTRAKIADMPNTDAIKNYDAYAAQEAAAGRQPKSREQLQLEMNRSGASTINTGAQTGVADMVKDSRATALAAARGLTSLRNARQALQGGMVNGQFADEKMTLTKALKAFGAPVDDSAVVNAETFRSAIAPQIAATVKATVGSANISDGDRKFSERAAGGDITLDGKSIARLLDIGERASMQVLKDHNELVQNAYPADSSDAEVQRFNRIFNVKEPEAPPVLDSGQPGASTPAPKTGGGKPVPPEVLGHLKDPKMSPAQRAIDIKALRDAGFEVPE